MKLALDTNILVYAEGVNGAKRQTEAIDVIARLPATEVVLPVQALGELFQVLVRKSKWSVAKARLAVLSWRDSYSLVETSDSVLLAAAELATRHQFNLWDGVVLAAAAESGCRLLLSEDLQDGFTWSGVTVANPFAASPHPLLRGPLI
jgi:predicted nucleic acid-binding protein